MQYDNSEMPLPSNNLVTLSGTVTEANPTNDENNTNDFLISVNRLSGQQDKIPVVLAPDLKGTTIKVGQNITVKGIFTSFNKIVGDRSKLILLVQATEIIDEPSDRENPNSIEIVGYICKAPIYRTTPFNREIADLLLAVNRSFNKSDYIPAIAWGKNARFAKNLLVGEKVQILGRIQSREYQKRFEDGSAETRIAYEVSINAIMRTDAQ